MIRLARMLWLVIATSASCVTVGKTVPLAHAAAATSVAWQPWSRATFERAHAEGKYLLVSVQTEWCHWCHVMNDVTYRDPRVAQLLAQHFVSVRVDADQRPDLAERYARWGWPATGLLTPEADTVINLRGYQEPDAFAAMLAQLHARGPAALRAAISAPGKQEAQSDLYALRDFLVGELDARRDLAQGGWGAPQKAPRAAPIEHALFRQLTAADTARGTFALRSLEGYRQLLDPVWGGAFQYSVHGDWQHPHYEKIHSVQASLIENFVDAFRATSDARYLGYAHDVTRYLFAHLLRADGAFYANQDADVGQPGATFHREGHVFYALPANERADARAPAIDKHVYASYNALTISALLRVYAATLEPELLARAERAYGVIERNHRRDAGYTHAEHASDPRLYLEDQVEMARALLALHEVTGKPAYGERLRELGNFMLTTFEDPRAGGFFAHTADPEAAGEFSHPRKPLAGNARAARVLLWMARRESEPRLRLLAERALRSVADRDELASDTHALAEYLLTLEDLLTKSVTLTIVGDPADQRTQALQRAALASYAPNRRLLLATPGESHYPYLGEPALYLCSDNACSLPIADPAAVAAATSGALSAAD